MPEKKEYNLQQELLQDSLKYNKNIHSFKPRSIAKALYNTVLECNEKPLRQLYEEMKLQEKTIFEERNLEEKLYLIFNSDVAACKELTGLTTHDLEANYPFEESTGVFEGRYDAVKYYEGLAFGKWESKGFISHIENGYYEVDENSLKYKSYKEKQMNLTIQKICKKYPASIYQKNQDGATFTNTFFHNLQDLTIQSEIDERSELKNINHSKAGVHTINAVISKSTKNTIQRNLLGNQFGVFATRGPEL